MQTKFYLIIFLVMMNQFAYANTFNNTNSEAVSFCNQIIGDITTELKLTSVQKLFQDLGNENLSPEETMFRLFESRLLIPDKGKILIVGSYVNFYEWLIPLMARPDIEIMAADLPDDIMIGLSNLTGVFAASDWSYVDEKLERDQSNLFNLSAHAKNIGQVEQEFNNRLTYVDDVVKSLDEESPYDLVMMISPNLNVVASIQLFDYLRKHNVPTWLGFNEADNLIDGYSKSDPQVELGIGPGNFYSGRAFLGAQGDDEIGFYIIPNDN